jgi:phage terminase large subunit-like protein
MKKPSKPSSRQAQASSKPSKGTGTTVTTKEPPVRLTAKFLKSLDPVKVREALSQLGPIKVAELKHDWNFWARDEQLEPSGDWNTWFINAGRGFGKTRTGVEWVREQVKQGKKRICAVAATNSDIERVMVKGESGFLNVCHASDKTHKGVPMGFPEYSPTKRALTWSNGATVQFFSAEEPDRLRGPQFEIAWCDELAAWNKDIETWDMLQFCMRLGKHPRIVVTTTPKPTKLVRKILKDAKTYVTGGSTFDNADNLAPTYIEAVRNQYEGTRLGRQELYAEILEEAEGALWTTDTLESSEIKLEEVPFLNRIVVAIDPAVTTNAESDMTGIVVAGIDVNGVSYVLGDYTDKLSPQGWASKAISLYYKFNADRIVAEKNQGGEMVRRTLEVEDETVPIRLVHASRGKYARAEPVSALYERGLVKHVRNPEDSEAKLDELETQMRTWEPLGSIGSPDRLDALVWAITDLALNGYAKPQLALVYTDQKGLR